MRTLSLFLALLTSQALAQIQVPEVVAPFEPVIVGCKCIIPEDGGVQLLWETDTNAKSVTAENGNKLHVWPKPGPHWIRVVVIGFKEVTVTISGGGEQKIKTLEYVDRYAADYTVGEAPNPPPGPGPPGPKPPGPQPPGPGPSEPFAAEVRKLLLNLGPGYDKAKALRVADNYEGVAAKAVATSEIRNLQDFVLATTAENGKVFSVEDAAVWGPKFFDPGLASLQKKLFDERKLSSSNVAGIAQLWRDTAAAIRVAVF